MTHKDIYTKFMIEYDKANVTSSYPSLTEYEVATILDKAYNALIAQKVTGNNIRRAAFEADTKSISDLQTLVVRSTISVEPLEETNVLKSEIPTNPGFLYFVSGSLVWKNDTFEGIEEVEDVDTPPHMEPINNPKAYDHISLRRMPVKLVSHDIADKFIASSFNIPWIKIPVCYIDNNYIYTVYDSFKYPQTANGLELTYIKAPKKFVSDSMFTDSDDFECNDTIAEELISLAITFALENVESLRLNSKLNIRGLEA